MNLRSIEYFLAVAEELNFTKAAKRLSVTQQALSGNIKRLEEEYNVQFFERRPSLRLTPEGEKMVFYGRKMLNSEREMQAAFSDISKNYRGSLTIGISRLRGQVFFPSIWNEYHKIRPNIAIEQVDGHSNELDGLLQHGKIDLYIGVDPPHNPNQHRIELAREKMQVCIAQSLLEQYRPSDWSELFAKYQSQGVDLTEIIDLPFITLRKNNQLRQGLELFFSHHLSPTYIIETNQQELIYSLSKGGSGVGLASPIIFYRHLPEIRQLGQAFQVLPIANDIPENSVYLVHRKDSVLPQYAKDFIQVACKVFHNYNCTMSRTISVPVSENGDKEI